MVNNRDRSPRLRRILVLITPGFDDTLLMACVGQLRATAAPVSLVGLSGQLVRSRHGIQVQPDLSLNDLEILRESVVLLLADSPQIAASQLTDPRVKQLMQRVFDSNGQVVALPQVAHALQQSDPGLLAEASGRLLIGHATEADTLFQRLYSLAQDQ